MAGTLGSGDDTLTAGLLLENLDGGAGIDSLTLDYSGVMADGRTVTEVYINLRDSKHESIYLSDGTSPTPVFAGFGSGNIIGSAGADDIRGCDFRNTLSGGGGDDILQVAQVSTTYTAARDVTPWTGLLVVISFLEAATSAGFTGACPSSNDLEQTA